MWSTERTHTTTATPDAIFALWADVANWKRWDASLVDSTIDGPFTAGTTGTLHPEGAPGPLPFVLLEVTPGASFSDETAFGPLTIRFMHSAVPSTDGTTITVRVEVEGPDEAAVGEMVVGDLPESLVALARVAEARTVGQ